MRKDHPLFIFLILVFVSFYSCEELKEGLVNCVAVPKKVELEEKTIIIGEVFKEFRQEIDVSVTNVINTGFNIWKFEIIGDFPAGIGLEAVHDSSRNYLLLTGMPKQQGFFEFELKVEISVTGTSCAGNSSRVYNIEIQ